MPKEVLAEVIESMHAKLCRKKLKYAIAYPHFHLISLLAKNAGIVLYAGTL